MSAAATAAAATAAAAASKAIAPTTVFRTGKTTAKGNVTAPDDAEGIHD